MTDLRPGATPDPREGRQHELALFLRVILVCLLCLTALTLVLPGDSRELGGRAVWLALVATPVARIIWLIVRWGRKGDRRYAVTATGLVGVIGLAALVGLL